MTNTILTPEETASLNLRGIYASYGYKFYRMRRFEEYDFYAGKKDFLISSAILAFTDLNGKLMALRPDVTLSVIKHAPEGRYFYDEKVYRVPKNSSSFREISQCGIEYTLPVTHEALKEVLRLAVESLHAVSGGRRCVLDVADAGEISRLMPDEKRPEILRCIVSKNIHGLKELGASQELLDLVSEGREIPEGLCSDMAEIRYDCSAVTSLSYYDGLVFKGYIDGIPEAVISGGQYSFEGKKGAGFAVYLDTLEGSCGD